MLLVAGCCVCAVAVGRQQVGRHNARVEEFESASDNDGCALRVLDSCQVQKTTDDTANGGSDVAHAEKAAAKPDGVAVPLSSMLLLLLLLLLLLFLTAVQTMRHETPHRVVNDRRLACER